MQTGGWGCYRAFVFGKNRLVILTDFFPPTAGSRFAVTIGR